MSDPRELLKNASAGADDSVVIPRETDAPLMIELEPFDGSTGPQRNVGQFPDARMESSLQSYTIPEHPLHLCPNCDYNLTGLTSRRCPECGAPFTVNEARMHGIEKSVATQQLRHRVQWGHVRGGIGVFLMIAAFVGANAIRLSGPMGPTVGSFTLLTFPGMLLLVVTGGLLLVATLYKLYYELVWPNLLLGIGFLVFMLSLVFVI